MADTCPHGFAPSECLICPTLPDRKPAAPAQPNPAPAPEKHRGNVHVGGLIVGIAVVGLVAWVVAGAVFAILHVLELIVVAGAAGWIGYRLGRFRGGRPRR